LKKTKERVLIEDKEVNNRNHYEIQKNKNEKKRENKN